MRIILSLALWLLALPALAATFHEAMAERNQWQQGLALVQTALQVKIHREGQTTTSTWLFIERTPNGRLKIVSKSSGLPDTPVALTFLVQDGQSVALSGDRVQAPPAPWMLGHYLFGETLEPGMLLSWIMGLPGESFALDGEPALLHVSDDAFRGIEQDGWNIRYDLWAPLAGNLHPTPVLFSASKAGTRLSIVVHSLLALRVPPEGYSEFVLR